VLHQSQAWGEKVFSRVFHAIVGRFLEEIGLRRHAMPCQSDAPRAIERSISALRIADLRLT